MFRGSNSCTGIRAAAPRFTALNANCNEWITLSKRQSCVAGISAIEALSRSRAHLCARFKNSRVTHAFAFYAWFKAAARYAHTQDEGGWDRRKFSICIVCVRQQIMLLGGTLPPSWPRLYESDSWELCKRHFDDCVTGTDRKQADGKGLRMSLYAKTFWQMVPWESQW